MAFLKEKHYSSSLKTKVWMTKVEFLIVSELNKLKNNTDLPGTKIVLHSVICSPKQRRARNVLRFFHCVRNARTKVPKEITSSCWTWKICQLHHVCHNHLTYHFSRSTHWCAHNSWNPNSIWGYGIPTRIASCRFEGIIFSKAKEDEQGHDDKATNPQCRTNADWVVRFRKMTRDWTSDLSEFIPDQSPGDAPYTLWGPEKHLWLHGTTRHVVFVAFDGWNSTNGTRECTLRKSGLQRLSVINLPPDSKRCRILDLFLFCVTNYRWSVYFSCSRERRCSLIGWSISQWRQSEEAKGEFCQR